MGGCASRPKVLESQSNHLPTQDSVTPKVIVDTTPHPQVNNVEVANEEPMVDDVSELGKEEEVAPKEENVKPVSEEVEKVESMAVEPEIEATTTTTTTTEDVLVVDATVPETTQVETIEDVFVVNATKPETTEPGTTQVKTTEDVTVVNATTEDKIDV